MVDICAYVNHPSMEKAFHAEIINVEIVKKGKEEC